VSGSHGLPQYGNWQNYWHIDDALSRSLPPFSLHPGRQKDDIEFAVMITLYKQVAPERISYYSISDQQLSLLNEYGFTVSYTVGKAGTWHQRRHVQSTIGEMDAAIRRLIARKLKDGYSVLYTFGQFKRTGQSAVSYLEKIAR
jgi:hypothetical protein